MPGLFGLATAAGAPIEGLFREGLSRLRAYDWQLNESIERPAEGFAVGRVVAPEIPSTDVPFAYERDRVLAVVNGEFYAIDGVAVSVAASTA
jgi:hypothetical protein